MRSMILTICLSLALVILISLFCGYSSLNTSKQLQARMEEIEKTIQDADWQQAERLSLEVEKAWKKKSPVLSMWVSHDIIDDIGVGIAQLTVSVQQQEAFQALLFLKEISETTSFIYQKDAFALKNIF